jgi:sulfur-carrier protein adenylyltransferase/sulfurtransferase
MNAVEDTQGHVIPGELLQRPVRVTVVGCGGTGSAFVSGLPLLHQAMLAFGHPEGLGVSIIDGDRISATNCVRQPFCENEIGLFKSTVLATRINLFYGLAWRAQTEFVDESWRDETDILVSCVDTRKARKMIIQTSVYRACHYWLDIGNNPASGQFVLGQPYNRRNANRACRLPTVAELFPEIVNPELDKKDTLPSCSALEALTRQEPFINQSLANLALAMLARLFRHGRLSYHGGFVNLEGGLTAPIPVNPQTWTRIGERTNHLKSSSRGRQRSPRPAASVMNTR